MNKELNDLINKLLIINIKEKYEGINILIILF